MRMLCGLFGKTRQAYYQQQSRQEKNALQEDLIVQQVVQLRTQLPGVGTGKLQHLLSSFLADHHVKLGRDKLYDLLRANHLLRYKRRKRAQTTNSQHPFYKYENLVKNFTASSPNQLWVSDITYIRTGNDFSYLSLITDAYSHQIMGWALEPTLHTRGPLSALQMAVKVKGKGKKELIHHSDRGLQYCCQHYVKLLNSHDVRISMTKEGKPGENAIAERINGTIKEEFNCRAFLTFDQAKASIAKAIEAYNHLRPHASCDYLTPAQAHMQEGPLRKRWRKPARKTPMNQTPLVDHANRILLL
jgi:putative transposase